LIDGMRARTLEHNVSGIPSPETGDLCNVKLTATASQRPKALVTRELHQNIDEGLAEPVPHPPPTFPKSL
jgi:hypothetical protein